MDQSLNEYQRIAEQTRRDELVVSHLALVKHIIGRLIGELPPGVDVENLESAGVLGLVEAAAKFDPTRNAQFKTFAYLRVKGAILDEMRRNSMFPQQVLDRIAAIRRATRALPAPVAIADLMRATGLTEDEIGDTLAAMRMGRMTSWEQVAESGAATPLAPTPPPDVEIERREQLQLLAEAIEALPERKRLLVTMYYREDMRLKEISAVVGLSESRISRMLSAALFELQEYIRGKTDPDHPHPPLVARMEELWG